MSSSLENQQNVLSKSSRNDNIYSLCGYREVWMPIIGYEGFYEISTYGRVARRENMVCGKPTKVLAPSATNGYLHVSLSVNNVITSHRIHVLVLKSFCGDRPFEGAHAAHNDGDRLNCRLSNLRWATPKENQDDIKRHGRRPCGNNVFGAVLTDEKVIEIKSMIANGERNRPIAERFGVSISSIHHIRHGKTWRHIDGGVKNGA